jgi:hypothetical protein
MSIQSGKINQSNTAEDTSLSNEPKSITPDAEPSSYIENKK